MPATPTRSPIIRLERVSRFYKADRPALFDISFDLYPGEFIYVVGPSGAGKTTLLKLIHASEPPDTGNVLYAGCNLADLKRSAIALLRRSIGMIFQDFRLIPDLSIAANVGLPLELAGVSRSSMKKKVDAVLERVGLSSRSSDLAAKLSGGEQQRVAIARAVVGEPEVILADEPTGNLDAFNADFVLDLIEQASIQGAAVVLATHDRTLTASRPHRIIALEKGRIIGASPDLQSRRSQDSTADKRSKGLERTG